MTEIKPCPMCGTPGTRSEDHVYCNAGPAKCSMYNWCFDVGDWNNAWAHKRIAELSAKVQELECIVERALGSVDDLRAISPPGDERECLSYLEELLEESKAVIRKSRTTELEEGKTPET